MTKKRVRVVRAADLPDSETYPKRAKQLVRHGRAVWLDEGTIRLTARLPGKGEKDKDMETTTKEASVVDSAGTATATPAASRDEDAEDRQEWVEHFRTLVVRVLDDDGLSDAMQTIKDIYTNREVSPADAPAHAIARLYAANQELRAEALRVLKEFLTAGAR